MALSAARRRVRWLGQLGFCARKAVMAVKSPLGRRRFRSIQSSTLSSSGRPPPAAVARASSIFPSSASAKALA
jgi:hypothetical protein